MVSTLEMQEAKTINYAPGLLAKMLHAFFERIELRSMQVYVLLPTAASAKYACKHIYTHTYRKLINVTMFAYMVCIHIYLST